MSWYLKCLFANQTNRTVPNCNSYYIRGAWCICCNQILKFIRKKDNTVFAGWLAGTIVLWCKQIHTQTHNSCNPTRLKMKFHLEGLVPTLRLLNRRKLFYVYITAYIVGGLAFSGTRKWWRFFIFCISVIQLTNCLLCWALSWRRF